MPDLGQRDPDRELGSLELSCAYGPFSVVLMGLGVAKVDQDAIDHKLRHKAAETLNRLRNAFLVG
jgi:hypothetical protein